MHIFLFENFHFSQGMIPPASLSPYKGSLLRPAWAAFYSGSPSGPPARGFQCFKGDLPGPENWSSSEDSVSPFSFGFPHKRFPAPCCPGAIYI